MPILRTNALQGLTANDRTEEETQAINNLMHTDSVAAEEPDTTGFTIDSVPTYGNKALINQNYNRYLEELEDKYQQVLAEREQYYGTEKNSINTNVNDYLDNVAGEVSSYYKKFKNTDKLPITDQEKKEIAAEYDARKETYGEDHANIWLDNKFKDIVGNNQSWWEQATNAISHLIPAIEGGAIQAFGNIYGAVNHIFGGGKDNQDLNWWDSFLDDMLDNPITRYGRDVEMSGASNVVQGAMNLIGLSDETAADRIEAMKSSATQYNPEGIGADAIVTTEDQDNSWFTSATPWQALQSGGFTALSMLVGAGEAKAANWIFGKGASGMKWLNSTGRAFRTAESLERGLEGLKRVQNFVDIAVIPGAVGSMEGAIEGLNTKIETERNAVDKLDDYYREIVSKQAEALYNDEELNPLIEVRTDQGKVLRRQYTPEEAFQEVWNQYQDEYVESRRQIEWAASKAGIHNFYANSLINGMMNTTLKAGLMAPRVQETLRNSKMFGWAYRNPSFRIDNAGAVTYSPSKLGAVLQVLKEPFGEGAEEYLQSLSNDVFSGAAENNIDKFIKNKFEGDGSAKVADTFGSDYAAALAALGRSLSNKESIQSAILGALSSTMGTVGGIGRGYHRDEKGNLVRNSLFDPRNFTRGLNAEGGQESWTEYARRATPWRSGLINAYFDNRREQAEANETAATLTEWLKDPTNKAKWDGLTGTANWITDMENAAGSNDQFSYRKAQMGKAINDIFMLSKLKGTDFYDAILTDLQRSAAMDVSSKEAQDMIQKIRQNGGDEYLGKSDEEIVEKIKSNANKMLGLMATVEREGRNLDWLLGRIDEDTKQSLIFGKIMEQDFTERRDQLQEEIDAIKARIQSSVGRSNVNITDGLKKLILTYGSINKALKAQEALQEQKEKVEQRIEELEKIDKEKLSDKQKEELIKSKNNLKAINRQLDEFDSLNGEDGEPDVDLAYLVMSEDEIMDLDPVTRAIVLAQGANRLYNATHQNRQKIDQLNLEIDEIQHQIDALEAQKAKWSTADGRVKKGHNKQFQRNTKKVEELQKQKDSKMRALDAERGKTSSKPVYSSAQQEVIDNLAQQGMAQDADFLDKVVDMGRLEKGIKDYHTQYQAILSDPKAFQNYVQRAKYNAQRDLTRRRAERIANIQNFQEYSQELDRLTANASQQEMNDIMAALREQDRKAKSAMQQEGQVESAEAPAVKTNFDRYMENISKQGDLVRQFAKNPNLTDNDQSLLLDAMQYLSSKGVDVTDREAAVQTLIERDEQGNMGGMFRRFVEDKNAMMPEQQRAFMPQFTSIGQIVGQYVDLLNGATEDAVNRGNLQPTVTVAEAPQPVEVIIPYPSSPTPSPTEEPQKPAGPSLFDIGGSTPEAGHFVDDNGTVATGAQTQVLQQEQSKPEEVQKSAIQETFEKVTTPEVAKMVDASSNIIETSNASEEVKDLARQYLEDIAVKSDVTFNDVDDVLTAMQEQINRLKEMSNQQEEENNSYYQAAGILQKMYGSLSAKKMRGRRTLPVPSNRPENPRAAWIHTANIAYMERMNPNAWAVRFTNDHAIDEWNRDHVIERDTPVYFITDSEWTAEVTSQMTPPPEMLSINPRARVYDTLSDMPVVAAVRVEAPANPNNTTAIEVDGLWYQPIGVMPSSKSKSQGAERTLDIRKNASKEQGRYLVMEHSTPTARPLTTRVYGVNYLTAHHPDSVGTNRQNTVETNTDVLDDILKTLPRDAEDRLRAMPKEEMLKDSEYLNARNKFLNGLSWNAEAENGALSNQLTYTPDNRREGEAGSPMIVFIKPMEESVSRASNTPLAEVLENGSDEDVRTFNSRTQRLFDEVLRPLFQYLPLKDKNGDRSAKIITQDDITANPNALQEEAERLTRVLNGYEKGIHGISDFIYIKPNEGWSIRVVAPEALQVVGDVATSKTVYKVLFVNQDSSIAPIEIGTIRAGLNDANTAIDLLRNIMWDSETGQIRGFINWQVPKADAQNLNNADRSKSSKPRQNIGAIVDDGILSLAGSSLVYDVDGVKLQAPIATDGRIIYPEETVSNPTNAQPAAPVNVTPQGEGAIITNGGQSIEPDSGAALGDNNPPAPPKENLKLKKAKEIVEKIIADSKEFTLSEDETYYYVTDKNTGERTKYLRVTTVIGADESAPQWNPSIQDIYNKLRERHSLAELDVSQVSSFKDINHMSLSTGVSVAEIRRAIAELRTQHKKEKYGAWSVPSTAIGNTADIITRDFFNGDFYMVGATQRPDGTMYYSANSRKSRTESSEHKLEKIYPNATREAIAKFVYQLQLFKNDLDSRGIHIVSKDVMAHGKITMTDTDGNTHDAYVAGTLDLFGYDDEGNFYIFDMKTTRDHGDGKLIKEKDKWSRQVSLYADLLKQSYPGFEVSPENLRIIPINVDYPTPYGSREEHLNPLGPQYSVTDKGQLQTTITGQNPENFDGSNIAMRNTDLGGQFQVGYTPFKINWDNLSSEDQDIAEALAAQTADETPVEQAPQEAQVEFTKPQRPSFIAADAFIGDYGDGTQEAAPAVPPVVPVGQEPTLPSWKNLTSAQKQILNDVYGIENSEDYNELLNDPATAEGIAHDLGCKGVM